MNVTVIIAIIITGVCAAIILMTQRRVRLVDVDDAALDALLAAPADQADPLQGGVPVIYNVTPGQLDRIRERGDVALVDIRQPFEHASLAPISGAACIPLFQLRSRTGELDPARNTVVLCLSGPHPDPQRIPQGVPTQGRHVRLCRTGRRPGGPRLTAFANDLPIDP